MADVETPDDASAQVWLRGSGLPPALLVGKRVDVEKLGQGVVKDFTKARFVGASDHHILFDGSEETVKVELARHGNGKSDFKVLWDAPDAARPYAWPGVDSAETPPPEAGFDGNLSEEQQAAVVRWPRSRRRPAAGAATCCDSRARGSSS